MTQNVSGMVAEQMDEPARLRTRHAELAEQEVHLAADVAAEAARLEAVLVAQGVPVHLGCRGPGLQGSGM